MTLWCYCSEIYSAGKQDMSDFPHQLSQYNPNKFIFPAYSVVFIKMPFRTSCMTSHFIHSVLRSSPSNHTHDPTPAWPHCSSPLLKIETFFNLTKQPLQKLHIYIAAWHIINFLFLIFQDSLKIPSMSLWGSPDETEKWPVSQWNCHAEASDSFSGYDKGRVQSTIIPPLERKMPGRQAFR